MPFPCGDVWKASTYSGHGAIDWNFYPDDNNKPVVASASGTATLYFESLGGYQVIIDHGDGWQTVYAHLQQNGRVSGAVAQGQVIGYVGGSGNNGNGFSPHLHWEQKLNGVKQTTLYAGGVALSPGSVADSTAPSYTSKNCGSSFSGDSSDDIFWYESWNNGGQGTVIKANSDGTDDVSANAWFTGFAAPTWSSPGDFNGDGLTDLAWYESWNTKLTIFFSNGSSFSSSKTWFTGYGAPTRAFVGDFTGDGFDDIGWYEGWNGTLTVIKTSSNGTPSGSSNGGSYSWLVGWGNPTWAGVGNFDGDKYDDIAWYESWNNGTMKVVFSNGSGTREIKDWVSGFAAPTWAGIGNFTGGNDKKDDLAWYEAGNNGTMNVIQSNGTSSGPVTTWFSGFGAPTLAFVGNFNGMSGDYRDDIAWYEASNNGQLNVIITNSAGTGGAGAYTWFTGFATPTWAAAG
ncbi:MAG: peptidoglycan DD-metalloendopeptidase family protein [Patescibacteria group bacterium]